VAVNSSTRLLWTVLQVVVGVPAVLLGCVVTSAYFSGSWPFPAFVAIVLCVIFIASLVRTLQRDRFSRRWRWPVVSGALWALSLLCLLLTMLFATARQRAWLANEEAHLNVVARALETYRSDWDEEFPPAEGWDPALKPYFPQMGSRGPSQRPFSHQGWNPGGGTFYRYIPPKRGQKPEHAVIISITDWEDEMGVHLYLYGNGRVERRSVWPWWKYLWTGKVFH